MSTFILLGYFLPLVLSALVWLRLTKVELNRGIDFTIGAAFVMGFTTLTPFLNWLIPLLTISHGETRRDVFNIDFAEFFDKPLLKGKRK